MPAAKHREKIKKRFIKAVEAIAREKYPAKTEADIIRSLGFAPPNYYKMRSNAGNYPTLDHCFNVCNKYSISADWLIMGTGDMFSKEINKSDPVALLKAAIRLIE